MAMTTRCPQCGTSFKVVPDQLRLRNGLVRCGECATIFDGRACLVAQIPDSFESDASPALQATPTRAEISSEPADQPPAVLRGRSDITKQDPYLGGAPVSDADGDEAAEDEPAEHYATERVDHDEVIFRIGETGQTQGAATHAKPSGHDEADPRLGSDAYDSLDDEDDPDERDDPAAPSIRGESRTRYHGETDVGRTPPEFLDGEHQARRSFVSSLWGYACVLGLLVLAMQFLFVYRTTLAGMAPQLRPLLVRLCEPVGCEVGYVRRIDQISITSSSLQPPSGQAGAPQQDNLSKLVLRASLRNQYDQPQPWPALRLDLSDLSDTVVIRKILLPEDYLPKGQGSQPFEAGAEINIAVPIEVSGPHVTGFQLHKFFP